MNPWLLIGGVNGALAVAAGAFAAHGLKDTLDANALSLFETGARYHMYHALAIGLSGLAMRGPAARLAQYAAMFFLAGILLFSGSLYALALTGVRAVAIATPFGGVAFLIGWVLLAYAGTRLVP
jgi:uncharacterized membrane protein YgdD (TMEM256/DUF423 family)